jgi:hypothetical protein
MVVDIIRLPTREKVVAGSLKLVQCARFEIYRGQETLRLTLDMDEQL